MSNYNFDEENTKHNPKDQCFDVTIIGGGMIGLSLAIGLANEGFSVAVVEKSRLDLTNPIDNPTPDIRVSSLSMGSISLLKKIGVWNALSQTRVTPYSKLSTWDSEYPAVNFDAQQLGLTELGYMVENTVLQFVLNQIASEKINIRIFEESTLQTLSHSLHEQSLSLINHSNEQYEITSKLVVGADGANSLTRKLAHIGTTGWQYQQGCMLITIKSDTKEKDITWQQFTSSGPRAFLPLHDNWASLVWYDDLAKIKYLQTLSNEQLTNEVIFAFPRQIGHIEIIDKAIFPLTRMHANQYAKSGVVLVGDAAHTINPLAGQGANLGFKDISTLLMLVSQAKQNGSIWYSNEVLEKYTSLRYKDNLMMQSAMDGIYFAFKTQVLPLKLMRNAAFAFVENAPIFKKFILKYAVGL